MNIQGWLVLGSDRDDNTWFWWYSSSCLVYVLFNSSYATLRAFSWSFVCLYYLHELRGIWIYITKAGGVFLNTLQTPFFEEFLSLSFTLKKRRVLHSTDHSRRSWTYSHCSCSSWQVFVQWALLLYSSLPSQQSRASEERKIHTANAIVDFGRENETAQMTLVFAIKFHFIASS